MDSIGCRCRRALAAGLLGALAWVGLASTAQGKDGVAEIHGAVQAMPPGGGLVGAWTIAGNAVTTDAATVIKQEHGAIGIGAFVEVKGARGSDGSVAATRIEVESGAAAAAPPVAPAPPPAVPPAPPAVAGPATPPADVPPAPARIDDSGLEIEGLIDALPPAGLIGTWQVGGRAVVVTAATMLDDEHGPFAVGVAVEAHGAPDASGALVATRIERTAGTGAVVPALLFWGHVDALPTTAGFIGLWTVDGKTVNVSTATKIEQEDGPIVVGALVAVRGWPQANGSIEAHEVETHSNAGDDSPATPVVELVDDHRGRFHATANPAEAATLVANGWRPTGESFNAGGTHAVCRFRGRGGNSASSAFLTVDTRECKDVMNADGGWAFDSHAFAITPAVDGQCPADTVGVHRLYRADDHGSEVHQRYLVSPQAIAAALARGWLDEGVVMCARP